MTTQNNTPAVQQPRPIDTIRNLFEKQKDQLALALPKHLTPDRMVRVALTAINKNPKLLECTSQSLLQCLMELGQLGLEPDGRRAHLIPFSDKKNNRVICTIILDYKGLVELALNSGDVSKVHADIVCENDEFEYDLGEVRRHKIDFRKPRGAIYAVYTGITKNGGAVQFEVMTKDEIEGIRARSRSKDYGPWVTDWNEMAKKTVFRRASKWIKLSPEVREKIEKDDDQYEEAMTVTTPKINVGSSFLTPPTEKVLEVAPKVESAPNQGTGTNPTPPVTTQSVQKAPELEKEDIPFPGETPEADVQKQIEDKINEPVSETPKDRRADVEELANIIKSKGIDEAAMVAFMNKCKFTDKNKLDDIDEINIKTFKKNIGMLEKKFNLQKQ